MSYLKYCALLLFSTSLFASKEEFETPETEQEKFFPWLTGPLLTPSARVIPAGQMNYEPYLYVSTNWGNYNRNWESHTSAHNFYSIISQHQFQFGLPGGAFDIAFNPQFSWNHTHGASCWDLNDMTFGVDYQILRDREGAWWPAIKLLVRGNLPLGKYQRLNPHKHATDSGGSGSWEPNLGISMARLFWYGGHRFFAVRWYVGYTYPTAVHVKSYNTYGGGKKTRGKVFPGQNLNALIGMEYTWTQRWALACDLGYLHQNRTRFKGSRGAGNSVGAPSSEQFLIAPAIEYNWSAALGILVGSLVTITGRNSPATIQGIVAVNLYK